MMWCCALTAMALWEFPKVHFYDIASAVFVLHGRYAINSSPTSMNEDDVLSSLHGGDQP